MTGAVNNRHINTMAHKIDNSKGFNAFISFAQPAWHGLGQILTDAISTEDALNKGGLDYPVIKLPNIHLLPDGREIISEDSFFTVRTDVNKVLGSRLGKDYEVLQNIEALNVVDEILQAGTATIETAGAIDEGRRAFICLKVNNNIVIGSNDEVKQYILIANSHDGSLAITAMPTNVRVVCNNTLSAALRGKGAIKIRHTGNAKDRLSEAAKILGLIKDNTGINTDVYNKMAQTVISKEMMFDYFGSVFMTDVEIAALQAGKITGDVLSTRKQNIIAEVLNFANVGQGQAMAMKGNEHTLWSAYNAVTGYATRKKYSSADDRANSMLFGSTGELIQKAGILAANPAKIQTVKQTKFTGLNLN